MRQSICGLMLVMMGLFSHAVAADTVALLSWQTQTAIEQGQYNEAAHLLEDLKKQADTTHNAYWQTWVQAMEGYIALQQRQFELASHAIEGALKTSALQHWSDLLVRSYLYRGQLRQQTGLWDEADQDYEMAARAAIHQLPDMQASALIHRAALAQQQQTYQASGDFLNNAAQIIQYLPENSNRLHLQLDLAYQRLQLRRLLPTASPLKESYNTISVALQQAKQLHLNRQIAQALGYLAELYALEGRDKDAVDLLQQAVFYGQQEQARDLLLHFEWQLGRLQAQQGQQDEAIAAYRRAIEHIQALRQVIPITYENGRSSFRDTLAPAYLELADLLFNKAKDVSPQQRSSLLQEAQATVEHIKQSELEDYFQSRCELPSRPLETGRLADGVAVLYPVIFPTHIDVLLLTKAGLQHFSTPVQQTDVLDTINVFAAKLYAYDETYQQQAMTLYRYLMQPVVSSLQAMHISTLIYIPDGPLRLIPLSALYNGQRTVLEDYAVVISPGLSISGTVNQSTQESNVLLAGLSEPGSVVKELPDTLTQGLSPSDVVSRSVTQATRQRGIKLRTVATERNVQAIQSSLALPSVPAEMTAIEAQLPQFTALMNQAFTLQTFSEKLQSHAYRIVHIASHGFFDGTEQDSFIMTYDHLLTMNRLDALFHQGSADQAPDLIVLSACQTAEGNDRSPLGFSGVMVRSKVKNVLGSLWPVSDEATMLLMDYFYRYLKQGLSKADALRQAQLGVMKRKEFAGASFWSPFILVGSGE